MALENQLDIIKSNKPIFTFPKKEIVTRGLTRELRDFEAPYLEEKLLDERVFGDTFSYEHAFNEFKKYVTLAKYNREQLAMTSKPIDELWHQFILFTQEYIDFCDEHLERYLHHRPNTSYTPMNENAALNFVKRYRETFGNMPEIWGMKGWCDSGGCGNMCGSGCGNDCASCGSDGSCSSE